MDDTSTGEDLIRDAIAAVERAKAFIVGGREAVPFLRPTDLGALTPKVQSEALRIEAEAHRARPEWAALQCCLASSSQLLDVCQSLLQQPVTSSPREQMGDRKRLVNEVKDAGRVAYRAALILSGAD